MVRIFIFAAIILVSIFAPAYACLEPISAVHKREIGLIDAGIRKFHLTRAALAKAKKLRAESEALYKDGQYDRASEVRSVALIHIGYKQEANNSAGGVLAIGVVPQSAEPSAKPGFQDCAAAASWTAPNR